MKEAGRRQERKEGRKRTREEEGRSKTGRGEELENQLSD